MVCRMVYSVEVEDGVIIERSGDTRSAWGADLLFGERDGPVRSREKSKVTEALAHVVRLSAVSRMLRRGLQGRKIDCLGHLGRVTALTFQWSFKYGGCILLHHSNNFTNHQFAPRSVAVRTEKSYRFRTAKERTLLLPDRFCNPYSKSLTF